VKRALIALTLVAAGCRGEPSDEPPIHLIGDMDWQPKFQAQEATPFFPDGRAMRPLVEGTVARGQLRDDDAYWRGRIDEKTFVAKAPIDVDEKTIARGQERFGIYCTPCHDKAGSGHGIAVQRGFPPPIDLTGDRVRGMADGEIFDVITNGVRNMPSYRKQIPVQDRWSIVTWVRVLGHSQHASVRDVPPEMQGRIEPEGATP
jgi:mono/diheme cytochrome c family protein